MTEDIEVAEVIMADILIWGREEEDHYKRLIKSCTELENTGFSSSPINVNSQR